MDNAQLDRGLRVDRFDRFLPTGHKGKPFRPSTQAMKRACTPRFFSSVTLVAIYVLWVKLGSLGLGDPQAQSFLLARQVDTQRQIDRPDPDSSGITDFDVDAVQITNGIERIQWP